jgi:hypothetical protein
VTRAYAKVIDDANALDLPELPQSSGAAHPVTR